MDESFDKRMAFGFALALAALFANAALAHLNLHRVMDRERQVAHTHEVLDAIGGVLSASKDAETGMRGYVITGAPDFLTPYHSARAAVATELGRVKELTADNDDQQRRLALLEARIAVHMDIMGKDVSLRGVGFEPARQFVRTDQGKQAMDAIRDLVAEMERKEHELLVVREGESITSYWTAVATSAVALGLSVGMVGVAFVLIRRELTARRQAERGLARANEELEERVRARTADLDAANVALRRSNGELEQFASVASHDLQEPLRKIQAFGDRLRAKFADALGEQGCDYLERMQSSAARMRTLINDLLTFSRVTTKAQPFAPVDLAVVAREVVSDLEGRIQQTGGRVELGELPTVAADPLQMRQLLQNLIGNALKFHKPGEPPLVEVHGRTLEDTDANGAPGSLREITVRDNGIGFDEVYLDRIFEVFQRLHGRMDYEGTGMGLAISRRIVERHGGALTARSTPGQGAAFVVTLPLRHPESETTRDEQTR